jgi:hypothetical protein
MREHCRLLQRGVERTSTLSQEDGCTIKTAPLCKSTKAFRDHSCVSLVSTVFLFMRSYLHSPYLNPQAWSQPSAKRVYGY